MTYLAHRIAYALHNGADPTGMVVRHKCDNPPCVNPEHLEVGTSADNSADMITRGRSPAGEKNGSSKLTVGQVSAIRLAKSFGWTVTELAATFGISKSQVKRIVRHENWK